MPPENGVEFDTDKIDEQKRRKILYSRIEPSNVEPRLIRFLIERHIVKNERQADLLLVGVFLVCAIVSIVLFEHAQGTSGVAVTRDAVLKAISHHQ